MSAGPVRRDADGNIIDTGHAVVLEDDGRWICNCGTDVGDGKGAIRHLQAVVEELLRQDVWWRKLWRRVWGGP